MKYFIILIVCSIVLSQGFEVVNTYPDQIEPGDSIYVVLYGLLSDCLYIDETVVNTQQLPIVIDAISLEVYFEPVEGGCLDQVYYGTIVIPIPPHPEGDYGLNVYPYVEGSYIIEGFTSTIFFVGACDLCGGCTDQTACNYNENSIMDDGSCLYEEEDCAGTCYELASFDDCGICSGSTTNHHNNEDMDCNDDCFGTAFISECGCVEGETGLPSNWCVGCMDPLAVNYNPDAFVDDGCVYTTLGDVDGNSEINILDIMLIIDIIVGEITPNMFQAWAGDLDANGNIDVIDIIRVVQLII